MLMTIVQSDQKVILILMSGLLLVVAMVLGQMSLWKLRDKESKEENRLRQWLSRLSGITWFLIFTNLFIVAICIIYTVYRMVVPPSW
jgi:putative copper export protein